MQQFSEWWIAAFYLFAWRRSKVRAEEFLLPAGFIELS